MDLGHRHRQSNSMFVPRTLRCHLFAEWQVHRHRPARWQDVNSRSDDLGRDPPIPRSWENGCSSGIFSRWQTTCNFGKKRRDSCLGPGHRPSSGSLSRFPAPRGLIVENLEYQVAFSPDGSTLAAAETLNTLSLWDVETGRCFRRFYQIPIEHGFAFTPDGKTLVLGGPHFRYWDITRGHEVHRFPRLGEIFSLAREPSGNLIASANGDELVLTELSTGREVRRIKSTTILHSLTEVAFSPDGKMLASSGLVGFLKIWDAATGREIRRIRTALGPAPQFAFSPDSKFLAAGDGAGTYVWDLATGQEDPRFSPLLTGPTDLVCFVPRGTTIAVGGRNEVSVWNLETRRAIGKELFSANWTLAVAPDGSSLAAGGYSGVLHLWKLRDGAVLNMAPKRPSDDDPPSITAIAFSADHKTLATAGEDKRIALRDPTTGQERRSLEGHQAAVTGLAFTPDGKTLLSGSRDGTVLLWDRRVVDSD